MICKIGAINNLIRPFLYNFRYPESVTQIEFQKCTRISFVTLEFKHRTVDYLHSNTLLITEN